MTGLGGRSPSTAQPVPLPRPGPAPSAHGEATPQTRNGLRHTLRAIRSRSEPGASGHSCRHAPCEGARPVVTHTHCHTHCHTHRHTHTHSHSSGGSLRSALCDPAAPAAAGQVPAPTARGGLTSRVCPERLNNPGPPQLSQGATGAPPQGMLQVGTLIPEPVGTPVSRNPPTPRPPLHTHVPVPPVGALRSGRG